MVRGWCISGRTKSFALAGSLRTHGVERTSRANAPGKSELEIGAIGPVAPEGLEGEFEADRREAVSYGSFGFGRTVPGREFEVCELTETNRPERGRRFAGVLGGDRSAGWV